MNNEPVDYDALSRAVESGNYTARGPLESGATLRIGRPAKGMRAVKTTPVSYRLPEDIRDEVRRRVKVVRQANNDSELVRTALVEYFQNHPADK